MKVTTAITDDGLDACVYIKDMPEKFSADEVEALIRGAFTDQKYPDSSGFRIGHPEEAHEVCPSCGNRLDADSRVCMVCGQRICRSEDDE